MLLIAVTLGVAVTGVMLSVFYGQYRWLANQLVDASSTEYHLLAEENFEQKAHAELHNAADGLLVATASNDVTEISRALNTILIENGDLTGVQYIASTGESIVSGSYPTMTTLSATTTKNWVKK